ncbi:hypothetical protein MRX96_022799 [Rhipicephalus microplus]
MFPRAHSTDIGLTLCKEDDAETRGKVVVRAEVGVGAEAAARTDYHPQQGIGGATPGGKQKGPRKITWCDIVAGTKADSAQEHHLSGHPWAATNPGLAARMENMEKENRGT